MYKLVVLVGTLALSTAACTGAVTVSRDSEPYGMGYLSGRLLHDAKPSKSFRDDEMASICEELRDIAHRKSGMADDAQHNINFMDGCKSGIKGEPPPDRLREFVDN